MSEDADTQDPPEAPPPLSPVGQGDYIVSAGECMVSIAEVTGFYWETLWNYGANAELKNTRKNPNVLFPGDRVTIPAISTKSESKGTGNSYKFKVKGNSAKLNLQLLDQNRKPRGNLNYYLYAGPKTLRGNTDGDGCIHETIPADITSARLVLNNGKEIHELQIGFTDPVDDLAALQSRLYNLGFYAGAIDGQTSDGLTQAIEDFQTAYNLNATGQIDDATKQKLLSIHGS